MLDGRRSELNETLEKLPEASLRRRFPDRLPHLMGFPVVAVVIEVEPAQPSGFRLEVLRIAAVPVRVSQRVGPFAGKVAVGRQRQFEPQRRRIRRRRYRHSIEIAPFISTHGHSSP